NLSGTRDHEGEAALETPAGGNRGGTSPASDLREHVVTDPRAATDPAPADIGSPPRVFADRHVGPAEADVRAMLATLGVGSLDRLIDEVVPPAIRDDKPLALEPALSE